MVNTNQAVSFYQISPRTFRICLPEKYERRKKIVYVQFQKHSANPTDSFTIQLWRWHGWV
jgi:hypothetical protein